MGQKEGMLMNKNIVDSFADMIERGCKDEDILADALVCFIETGSHLDLIPEIASRLPSAQFTSDYWNNKGQKCWNPVFAAVMYCSDIEVFRMLHAIGYPTFPVVDLLFYPNPKEFLEIIEMNMPDSADEFTLYEIAVGHLMKPYIGRKSLNSRRDGNDIFGEVNRDSFYLSSYSRISAEMFDGLLARFIEYGLNAFSADLDISSTLFNFTHLICLNASLRKSKVSLVSLFEKTLPVLNFTRQEQSFLLKASIWSGNEAMYNYLADVQRFQFLDNKSDSENVPVLFNDKTDYSEKFMSSLFEKGPLSSRDSITKSIYDNLECFTYHGCPKVVTFNYLFERLGKFSSSDFPEPLTAVLIRNENFRFENENERRILDCLIHRMPHDLTATDKHGKNAFLYADDIDLIKYIIPNEPSIMWSADSEGRNIFHIFSLRCCSDPFGCRMKTMEELFRIVPSELFHQLDCHGKRPFDYLVIYQDG